MASEQPQAQQAVVSASSSTQGSLPSVATAEDDCLQKQQLEAAAAIVHQFLAEQHQHGLVAAAQQQQQQQQQQHPLQRIAPNTLSVSAAIAAAGTQPAAPLLNHYLSYPPTQTAPISTQTLPALLLPPQLPLSSLTDYLNQHHNLLASTAQAPRATAAAASDPTVPTMTDPLSPAMLLPNLQQAHLNTASANSANTSVVLPSPQTPLHHAAIASAQQQQEHLLASALLLSSVNPGLAAAAMAQALTMQPSNTNNTATSSLVNQLPQPLSHHNVKPRVNGAGMTAPHHLFMTNSIAAAVVDEDLQSSQAKVESTISTAKKLSSLRGTPSSSSSSPKSSTECTLPVSSLVQKNVFNLVPTSMSHALSLHGKSTINDTNKTSISSTGEIAGDSRRGDFEKMVGVRRSSSDNSKGNARRALPKSSSSSSSSTKLRQSSMTTMSSSFSVTAKPANASSSSSSLTDGGVVPSGAGPTNQTVHSRQYNSPMVASNVVDHNLAIPMTSMQRWSLDKLDAHVRRLRESHQPVPQAVALLHADMHRKEEKRQAKRLANRKSAYTSRARKKALIEEMTRDNARLRQQALILSFLPDPVVAIRPDGVITFCSMQVERVLKHDTSSLIGANIEDIIVPSSRESMRRLIRDLVMAEQRVALSESSIGDAEDEGAVGQSNGIGQDQDGVRHCRMNDNGHGQENNSASNAAAHEVSEHDSSERSSFPPLLEVNVNAGRTSTEVAAGEDVSDSSGDPPGKKQQHHHGNNHSSEVSSLTHKNSSLSGVGGESGEDGPAVETISKSLAMKGETESSLSVGSSSSDIDKNPKKQENVPSTECDDSTSSENKASANLLKNVELSKLNSKTNEDNEEARFSFKDDVMGAFVTANNADAKLSSLMHHPEEEGVTLNVSTKKSNDGKREEQSSSSADSSSAGKTKKRGGGNSSEDSGYRESNESPEESNEYPEDSSSSLGDSSDRSSAKKKRKRARPLAPACNVRLIRHDLSTIWCELTSSIRTKQVEDIDGNFISPSGAGNQSANSSESGPGEKELLLCFRPIREGEAVGPELRFYPNVCKTDGHDHNSMGDQDPKTSSSKRGCDTISKSVSSGTEALFFPKPVVSACMNNRPPKKRKLFQNEEDSLVSSSRSRSEDTQVDEPDEKSAIESMMELAKNVL